MEKDYSFQNIHLQVKTFSISTGPFESAEELINSIHQRYVEYDVDSEAYLWLDSEGHGKNGAPYRMRDVLEDMEACKKMIYDLFILLSRRL